MKQRPEVIISFSDIAWGILRRWRLLILVCVICTCACGIYSYVRSGSDSEQIYKLASTDSLSEADRLAVDSAVRLEQLYQKMLAEYDANYIIGMDENHVYTETIGCYFTFPKDLSYDYSVEVMEAYKSLMMSDAFRSDFIAEHPEFSLSEEDLSVLVEVSCEGRNMNIIFRGAEQSLCDALKEQFMKLETPSFSSQIGEYTLVVHSDNTSYGMDSRIAETKLFKKTALENAEEDAKNALKHCSTDLQQRVQAILQVAEGPVTDEPKAVSKKFLLIGVLAGLVIGIICALCLYVWSTRINNLSELEQAYGLNIFGRIRYCGKRRLKGLDAAIACKQYRVDARANFEDELRFSAARVRMSAEKEQVSRLAYVFVDDSRNYLSEVSEVLASETECNGMKTIYVNHLKAEGELLKMTECKRVVLLLRLGEGRRAGLEDILSVCREQDICIMGMIAIV